MHTIVRIEAYDRSYVYTVAMMIGATKRRILERAAAVASTEGLEQVTIGRLADDLGMSKAGLYGHFGSKERLQLETIALGREVFGREVVAPAMEAPPGLPRLWALCTTYLDYVAAGVFPGGDFFVTVANEYDTRPGRIRDEVAAVITIWMRRLEDLVGEAVELGHLSACDPVQLAFELEALLVAGNHVYRLNDDPGALERARAGIVRRLGDLRTPEAPALDGGEELPTPPAARPGTRRRAAAGR
jgi:AcrR family transcriptional regulator